MLVDLCWGCVRCKRVVCALYVRAAVLPIRVGFCQQPGRRRAPPHAAPSSHPPPPDPGPAGALAVCARVPVGRAAAAVVQGGAPAAAALRARGAGARADARLAGGGQRPLACCVPRPLRAPGCLFPCVCGFCTPLRAAPRPLRTSDSPRPLTRPPITHEQNAPQSSGSAARAQTQRRFLDLLLRLCSDPSVPQVRAAPLALRCSRRACAPHSKYTTACGAPPVLASNFKHHTLRSKPQQLRHDVFT